MMFVLLWSGKSCLLLGKNQFSLFEVFFPVFWFWALFSCLPLQERVWGLCYDEEQTWGSP